MSTTLPLPPSIQGRLAGLARRIRFLAGEVAFCPQAGKLVPLIAVRGGIGVEIHLLRYWHGRRIPARISPPRAIRCLR